MTAHSRIPIDAHPDHLPSVSAQKWGKALDAGFQVIPDVLFRCQSKLRLDPADVCILMNLSLHWWHPDKPPFPSIQTIANRMGVNRRTIERRLKKLRRLGFIEKIRSDSAAAEQRVPYGFDGLVLALEKFAERDPAYRQGSRSGITRTQ